MSLSTVGPLWKKIEFQAARVNKFQAAAVFFTGGNSHFQYSQPGRIQQGSNKQNSSSTAANKKNAVNCQEKIHGIPTMGLGRELSYWSWKNWGVSFKSQTKELCVGSSWPRFAADLHCFVLFLVWQWWVMMITDDRMSLYVSLCKSSAFWAQPLFHFAETCFDLHWQPMATATFPRRPAGYAPIAAACLSPSGLPCWA